MATHARENSDELRRAFEEFIFLERPQCPKMNDFIEFLQKRTLGMIEPSVSREKDNKSNNCGDRQHNYFHDINNNNNNNNNNNDNNNLDHQQNQNKMAANYTPEIPEETHRMFRKFLEFIKEKPSDMIETGGVVSREKDQQHNNFYGNNNNNNNNNLDHQKSDHQKSDHHHQSDTDPDYWERLFRRQYPLQDAGLDYCRNIVEPRHRRQFEAILDDRNRHALEIAQTIIVDMDRANQQKNDPMICGHCHEILSPGTEAILVAPSQQRTFFSLDDADKSFEFRILNLPNPSASPYIEPQHQQQQQQQQMIEKKGSANLNNRKPISGHFHVGCFRCATCDQPLAHHIYCTFRGAIHCERHYLEKIRPRCGACSELIFSSTYLKELLQYWHMEHFACATCETALAGSRYVVHDDRPHCIACFEQNHSNVCDECQKPIGINCKDLSYKQRHWHEQCFVCCECKKTLLQQPFGSKCDRIYCGDCYDQMYGTRCEKCAQIFRPGQRKLEYRGKQWHDQCFTCAKCIAPIGTRSFVPKNDEIYCSECYEAKFATRCVKCSEIILSNGVMFKNEPWHKACFTCNQCTSQLAGAAFLVRDDKAYCRDCFAERFSHKCSACCKPIIGTSQQSTRFISFEEDYWHIECFVCVDCKTRLEGRGFIRDGADIICGECAKIKLQAEIDA